MNGLVMINKLKDNQIFVFGSNLAGNHMGGAALQAKEKFGAEDGVGEGLIGQSYAFPTLGYELEKLTERELVRSRDNLYKCAVENPDKEFLLTKVGCGIAGYPEEQMASLFANLPENVVLPVTWNKP